MSLSNTLAFIGVILFIAGVIAGIAGSDLWGVILVGSSALLLVLSAHTETLPPEED